jgi:hypothetical protein
LGAIARATRPEATAVQVAPVAMRAGEREPPPRADQEGSVVLASQATLPVCLEPRGRPKMGEPAGAITVRAVAAVAACMVVEEVPPEVWWVPPSMRPSRGAVAAVDRISYPPVPHSTTESARTTVW